MGLGLADAVGEPNGLPTVLEGNGPGSECVERGEAGAFGIVRFRINAEIRDMLEIIFANANPSEEGVFDREDAGLQRDDFSTGNHPQLDVEAEDAAERPRDKEHEGRFRRCQQCSQLEELDHGPQGQPDQQEHKHEQVKLRGNRDFESTVHSSRRRPAPGSSEHEIFFTGDEEVFTGDKELRRILFLVPSAALVSAPLAQTGHQLTFPGVKPLMREVSCQLTCVT